MFQFKLDHFIWEEVPKYAWNYVPFEAIVISGVLILQVRLDSERPNWARSILQGKV